VVFHLKCSCSKFDVDKLVRIADDSIVQPELDNALNF
jgi:hypothetical protein